MFWCLPRGHSVFPMRPHAATVSQEYCSSWLGYTCILIHVHMWVCMDFMELAAINMNKSNGKQLVSGSRICGVKALAYFGMWRRRRLTWVIAMCHVQRLGCSDPSWLSAQHLPFGWDLGCAALHGLLSLRPGAVGPRVAGDPAAVAPQGAGDWWPFWSGAWTPWAAENGGAVWSWRRSLGNHAWSTSTSEP